MSLIPSAPLDQVARKQLSACSDRDSSVKGVATKQIGGNFLSANPEEPNVNVVQSVWRRLKNDIKEAIIRDLQPKKDVKGGGDVKRGSKPTDLTRKSGKMIAKESRKP